MQDLTAVAPLKKRYLYKVVTSMVGLVIAIITQAIIPRELGPAAYGDLTFLSNFFQQSVRFLESGSSQCFFTKLSQRPGESRLVCGYFYFMAVLCVALMGFVWFGFAIGANSRLWPHQARLYVYLGAILALATWSVAIFDSMVDAYGLTVTAEPLKMTEEFVGLFVLLGLCFIMKLSLADCFYYSYFNFFLLAVISLTLLAKRGHDFWRGWLIPAVLIKKYMREFYVFSQPLFFYTLAVSSAAIFDQWFLSLFGGSVEQGYFGLAFRIAAGLLLFAGAMTPLLFREFSVAFGKEDVDRMAFLFRRNIPPLYAVAAYFACFVAFQASRVIQFMGGIGFHNATGALTIMAFYPIHSTYAQLSGVLFIATGQTKLYRNIGMAGAILGFPITYFLVAPLRLGGLGTGAVGLAIKMVALQVLITNVQLYFNTRYLKLPYLWYLLHQCLSVGAFLVCAYLAGSAGNYIFGQQGHDIINFIFSGIVYTLMIGGVSFAVPDILGLKKDDIAFVWAKLKARALP